MAFPTGRVLNKEFLFEREELMDKIMALGMEAKGGSFRDLAIIGLRRTGKTSVLQVSKKNLEAKGIAVAYVSVKECFGDPLIFFKILLKRALKSYSKVSKDKTLLGRFEDALKGGLKKTLELNKVNLKLAEFIEVCLEFKREEDLTNLAEKAFESLENLYEKSNVPFFLLIDEFQEAKWEGFMPFLREKIQLSKGLVFIVTGSTSMRPLISNKGSSFYGLFLQEETKFLSDGGADDLVNKQAKKLGIIFSPDAISEIKKFTNNHPYYMNVLCHELLCALLERGGKNVDADLVTSHWLIALRNLEPHLNYMYDALAAREQKVIAAIAVKKLHRAKDLSPVLNMDTDDICSTLSKLEDKEYIIKKERGYYLCVDRVFEDWLSREFGDFW